MTTVAEIQTAVGSMTGDIQNVLFTKADILRYLNWGTQELSRDLKITQNVLNGNPGTLSNFDIIGGVILPSDFVIENAIYMGVDTSSLQRLKRIPQNIFWQDGISPTNAQPNCYTVSDYLATPNTASRHLMPYPHMTPSASVFYRIEYQSKPPLLVLDTDTLQTPPILDELLMIFCTIRCKWQENDYDSAKSYFAELQARKQALLAEFAEHSDFEFYNIYDNPTPYNSIWD